MIPRIHQAELLATDVPTWLVYFHDPAETRFPIMRLVPINENPPVCPGGILWCQQFGCVPGDNVFTRATPELILEEGQKVPEDWEAPWDETTWEEATVEVEPLCNATTYNGDIEVVGWGECERCGDNKDCYQCDPDSYDYEEGPECTAGCDYGQHRGCEQELSGCYGCEDPDCGIDPIL